MGQPGARNSVADMPPSARACRAPRARPRAPGLRSESRQLDQADAVAMAIRDARATSSARRVLPEPPAPVSVTSRRAARRSTSSLQFPLASHEGGRRGGQRARRGSSRPAPAGTTRDALGDRLVELHRPDDVPEPVWSQVAQRDARRELRDEPDRRAREQNLAAMSDPEHPGRVMHGHPEQLVAQVGDFAGVDRDPDPDGHAVRPPFHRKGSLRLDGRGQGAAGEPNRNTQPSPPVAYPVPPWPASPSQGSRAGAREPEGRHPGARQGGAWSLPCR